uniref:Protein-serine/threonine kinase n=1 Tax=Grammatophora oceanica TaxID=210454 RepID=A0A7S1UXM2_9STRA|mmetsp:Transcript_28325/g.41736  ORF Transcript_28325/g.41736 Transcript_28325/m.41736 type:complete len:651 (+) Transcript_28325:198-2150(+)|eukprot:CAMPEP_0194055234 /NCGR_PEP_ID=MMETSP0009_2-20130614/56019_1 /TAXON_ID=210454 /ORGANISM="Grammatophora oceanica, Strain CCMP 410" /LENGTH=650 /DNA_ID=CAMNT_0038704063 /DNA_START=151 /DNA_END=2103 /DNA_ORIENTATION=-
MSSSLLSRHCLCGSVLRRQSVVLGGRRSLVSKTTKPRSSPAVVVQKTTNFLGTLDGQSSSSRRQHPSKPSAAESSSSKSSSVSFSSVVDEEQQEHHDDVGVDGVATANNVDVDNIDWKQLNDLAQRKPTPLRLVDMYKYATDRDPAQRLLNAQFLHKELPIRIAQRAVDLLTLPHGLNEAPSIQSVAHIYLEYMNKILKLDPPTTPQEEDKFTHLLQTFLLDRTSIPMQIAQGIQTWQGRGTNNTTSSESTTTISQSLVDDSMDPTKLQGMEDALYRFFTARVGLRLMSEHHILSCPGKRQYAWVVNSDSDDLGCIQTNCNPKTEVEKIAKQVKKQMEDLYGACPEMNIMAFDTIKLQKMTSGGKGAATLGFTYVPHHLQYMVSELLNNSCHATIKKYLAETGKTSLVGSPLSMSSSSTTDSSSSSGLPPIQVVVVNGAEDVSIKVADLGGGVPRSTMKHIWKFAHSPVFDDDDDNNDHIHHVLSAEQQRLRAAHDEEDTSLSNNMMTRAENHVRGFGLPLARIYARYFGGELTLKSMEGYGLDAYLYLPRLGDSCENLPSPVSNSPGGRDSYPTTITTSSTSNSTSSTSSSKSSSSSFSSTTNTRPFSTNSSQQQQQHHHNKSYSFQDQDEFMESETRRILNRLQGRAL